MEYILRYERREAATIEDGEISFAPAIEVLERDHPTRRFVEAMALYVRDVDLGRLPGPATGEMAGFYARLLLIPSEELLQRDRWPDVELAEHFNVPLAEIAARRADAVFVASLG